MSFTDNANYFFKEIDSKSFAISTKDRFIADNSLCSFWNNNSKPISFNVSVEDSAFDKYICVNFPKRILSDISKFVGQKVYIKIKFDDEQFFIESKIVEGLDLNSYYFVYTSTIYKAVRRSSCRYRCEPEDEIYAIVRDKKLKLYDISSGGFSLLIKRDGPKKLSVSDEIENLKIQIDNEYFDVLRSCIVNEFQYYKDASLIKFGVKFNEIDYKVEKGLWVKINTLMKKKYFREISTKKVIDV
jgi:uncharacterized protein YneR